MTYRTAVRWAPPFFEHIPMCRDHPLDPLISAGPRRFLVLTVRNNPRYKATDAPCLGSR